MSDYAELLISRAGGDGEPDGEALAAAILTRRLRKCIAGGAHPAPGPEATEQAKCARCGQ